MLLHRLRIGCSRLRFGCRCGRGGGRSLSLLFGRRLLTGRHGRRAQERNSQRECRIAHCFHNLMGSCIRSETFLALSAFNAKKRLRHDAPRPDFPRSSGNGAAPGRASSRHPVPLIDSTCRARKEECRRLGNILFQWAYRSVRRAAAQTAPGRRGKPRATPALSASARRRAP